MHLPRARPRPLARAVRSLGLLVAGTAAAIALWAATSPPATTTLAPAALAFP